MINPPTSLRLSIDVGSEPISGVVAVQDAEPRTFCGWVELAEAIESVRSSGIDGQNGRASET